MRHRLLVSVGLGLLVGLIGTAYQMHFQRRAGDLGWAWCGAGVVLAGGDPYEECVFRSRTTDKVLPTNPLTTVLLLVPFVALPGALVAGGVLGLATGVLAWALLQTGEPWRLLVLVSAPFWWSVAAAQWAPLLLAVALMPPLYPLCMVKPQIGLPIALMHFTWRRALVCAGIGAVTLLIDPWWMVKWLTQVGTYDGTLPVLVLPFGPLLLLAVLRWREERARWLLLYALVPQRFIYDQLLLFLVPQSRREVLVLVILSWVAFLGWFAMGGWGLPWAVVLLYLPCLLMVFREALQRRFWGRASVA